MEKIIFLSMNLYKHDDYGDLMTVKKWLSCVKDKLFIDDDGEGYWATRTKRTDTPVWPSMTYNPNFKVPKGITHVVWYNK